jgi:hypothetical protein
MAFMVFSAFTGSLDYIMIIITDIWTIKHKNSIILHVIF